MRKFLRLFPLNFEFGRLDHGGWFMSGVIFLDYAGRPAAASAPIWSRTDSELGRKKIRLEVLNDG